MTVRVVVMVLDVSVRVLCALVQDARTRKSEMHFCFKIIQFRYAPVYFDEFKTFLPGAYFKNVPPLRYFVGKF